MANLFIRITDVISANINDLIDRVEDPELMIKKIILEMEKNIREARNRIIDAIAREKALERELTHHRERSEQWHEKAETAMIAGNEALARKALIRKKDHEKIATDLEGSWQAARDTCQTLKSQLRKLESKLEEARRKRSTLCARQKAAEARRYIGKTTNHFERGMDAQYRFDRMEDRVRELEFRAEAIIELDDEDIGLEKEFDRLKTDREVDADIQALRKKLDGNGKDLEKTD